MSAEASQISSIEPADPSGRYCGTTSNASMRLTRVLVVDDDPSVQHMLVNYLEQHDMRVSSASQRQEVTRQFAVAEPNVVILDLRLGHEDGLDLLREIRSRSDVPVIITTGHRRDEIDRVVGLELGAHDYVTKPFGLRELLARIRAVLRRQETGRIAAQRESEQGRCQFGGWQLDRRARRLTNADGVPIALTKGGIRTPDRVPRCATTAAHPRAPLAGDTDSRRRVRPQHRCADPSAQTQAGN
jgi:two-component system OmpR family response regulator